MSGAIAKKYVNALIESCSDSELKDIALSLTSLKKAFELDKFNNIVSIYNVTGNYDAVIIARFKNRGQLNNFVKELQTFENVDKTNTSLVLNTIKEDIRVKFD